MFMKIPVTWSKIGRSTLVFMRNVLTSSSIATKLEHVHGICTGYQVWMFMKIPVTWSKIGRSTLVFMRNVHTSSSIATKLEHVHGICTGSQVWLFMKISVTWSKIGQRRTLAVMWSAHIYFPIRRKLWAWIKIMRAVTDMNFGENNSDRIRINGEYVRALFFMERGLTSWPFNPKLRTCVATVRFVRDILYLLRLRDARFALSTVDCTYRALSYFLSLMVPGSDTQYVVQNILKNNRVYLLPI
jgi:hypothetical protein